MAWSTLYTHSLITLVPLSSRGAILILYVCLQRAAAGTGRGGGGAGRASERHAHRLSVPLAHSSLNEMYIAAFM